MSDHTVSSIETAANDDNLWVITFDDGAHLFCAKKPPRDEAHIDEMITRYESMSDDPDHLARMRAMITAVREHEAESTP